MALTEGTEQSSNQHNPQEDVLKLVAKLQKELQELKESKSEQPSTSVMPMGLTTEQFKSIIEAAKSNGTAKDLDYEDGIYEEQIPADDFHEEGVRFCAPFIGYCIADDVRRGQRIKLPFGKKTIFFDYAATRKVQQGKYEATAPFSVYRSHSKKEIEWLRAHTYYNVAFYESSNVAVHADLLKIQKLGRVMTLLKNLDFHDIIKRCREYGVQVSEDAPTMRMLLAQKMVDKEMELEGVTAKQKLESISKEAMILNQGK